ncbi:MAG: hypothetical protein AAGD07_25855 [Planctomycetota bacterium]
MPLDREGILIAAEEKVDAPDAAVGRRESHSLIQTLRYERAWNRPGGLEPDEVVWLACAWTHASAVAIQFNGVCLLETNSSKMLEPCFTREITSLLQNQNRVQIDLRCEGQLWARLGEVAVWIESSLSDPGR